MSNAVVVFQDASTANELAPEFQALIASGEGIDDLGAGIGGNYSILSIRGKTFRVKYQGGETPIVDAKGDAIASLEAVIIKANPYLTKQYYENGYTEGESSPPVCFSIDGKAPAASVENPQHTNCAACPQNRFGSRITPAGQKVKACQDNKKLAIVPLDDLENADFGGPMLFRVPASALKDLLSFNNLMTARGYAYCAVAVRIGFDIDASYPKPTFKAIRTLTSEEAAIILAHRESDATERLLGDFSELNVIPVAEEVGAFEQEPNAPAQPKPAAPPPVAKPAAKPAVAAKPAAAPAKVTPPPAVKAAVKPTPVATKPAATPAAPPARKAAPAAKPAPAVQQELPLPVEEIAAAETGEEAVETPMDQSIEDILSELNAVAD